MDRAQYSPSKRLRKECRLTKKRSSLLLVIWQIEVRWVLLWNKRPFVLFQREGSKGHIGVVIAMDNKDTGNQRVSGAVSARSIFLEQGHNIRQMMLHLGIQNQG